MSDDNDERAEWVVVATFNTGFEADMARQLLEEEGIPVLAKSDAPGIFGAGFQGAVTGGVTLLVPDVESDRAMQLLEPEP